MKKWALIGFVTPIAAMVEPEPVRADPVVPFFEHCVINVRADDALNLRAGPSTLYRVWTTLPYATCGVMVTGECAGNWCPVEEGHYAGWVHRHYIAAVSPPSHCVVNVRFGDRLNLRAYPSVESRILAALPRWQCGITLLPYAVNGWQKIRVQGWEGWVAGYYLSSE